MNTPRPKAGADAFAHRTGPARRSFLVLTSHKENATRCMPVAFLFGCTHRFEHQTTRYRIS